MAPLANPRSQMDHKGRNGARAPYQERGTRYDITQGYLQKEEGGLVVRRGVLCRGLVHGRWQEGAGRGWGRGSEERQGAGSSTTPRPEQGRAARSGAEKGQGEPGKDGETSMTAGVSRSGSIDPGAETSTRYKQEDAAENRDKEGRVTCLRPGRASTIFFWALPALN